jgi:hypothetical protein
MRTGVNQRSLGVMAVSYEQQYVGCHDSQLTDYRLLK